MAQRSLSLANIRIVLVEPAGPLNVGAVARVIKNMGLEQLVLVNPQCDPQSEAALQMAVHAGDVLAAAKTVSTLPEALEGCTRAIATTARVRSSLMLESPSQSLPWLMAAPAAESALIFGPEDRGLSNTELNYAQRFVCIPTSPVYPSLNLAQAVAICCYELYKQIQLGKNDSSNPPLNRVSKVGSIPEVPLDDLEAYYQQMEAVLLKIGYLHPHTAASRMEKFRRLFNQAHLSVNEVAMLRGIFSQVEWAIQNDSSQNSGSPLNNA